MNALNILENRIRSCNKCERLRKATPYVMPHVYFSNQKLEIFIIARNPGLENDQSISDYNNFMDFYKNKWMDCKFGKYLIRNLSKEVIINNVFFTNICKCSSPNNSTLTKEEKNNCNLFLKRQIKIIDPKVIFTFGSDALEFFNIGKSLCSVFGKKIKHKNRLLIPMHHLSFLSRKPNPAIHKKQKSMLNDIYI